MEIKIRVIPNAKQNKITANADGNLRVYTVATPTDGKANDAVIKLLARHFGTSKSHIKILRGVTVRDKVIAVQD